MNKLLKYIGCALISGLIFNACSPEEFKGADPNGLPTIEGKQLSVETDQETNTAVFTVSGDFKGCYPVWYLDGKIYSILTTAGYHSMEQGTHELELRVMNRNGQSQAALSGSFTFNETKVDYTPYFKKLCEKEWRIDYAEVGHIGCGAPGTDASGWYSAVVNEKVDWGVYDDRIAFAHSDVDEVAGGSYLYDPGEGGTVYVNKSCSVLGQTPDISDVDVMVPVKAQNSTFTLIPGIFNGEECLFIQFAAETLLPYIPYDDSYNNPYFRIEALTNTRLVLVCQNDAIAWRMVFTSREDTGLPEEGDEELTMDWNYEAAGNLWKAVDDGNALVEVAPWFANNNWEQIENPIWSHEGDTWKILIPDGVGTTQWQGQFKIVTSLAAKQAKKYNVYCVVETDNDAPGVTVKLTDGADDNNFFFVNQNKLSADKPYIFKAEGVSLPLGDANTLTLVFDFAGTSGGTNVKISKVYLEEVVSYDDEANLWKTVDEGSAFVEVTPWFANNEWIQIDSPVWTHEGNVWQLVIPEGVGTTQWQAQFPIKTTLAAAMVDNYGFSCILDADNDIAGVTIKLTDGADDNNFFFADRHDIVANKTFVYKVSGVKLPIGDSKELKLFFDFAGATEGTKIKISNVILVKEN